MAAHQPGGDLEVLLLRRFAGPDDPLHAARIGREILLHEHVDALLHRVLQVRRTEAGVRGQHGHVARPQAVDRLAVGVEAQEPPFRRHVDPVAQQVAQRLVRLFEPVRAEIGHGDQLDRPAGPRVSRAVECRRRCPAPARRPTWHWPPPRCRARRSRSRPGGWCCPRRRGRAAGRNPARADSAVTWAVLLRKSRRGIPHCLRSLMASLSSNRVCRASVWPRCGARRSLSFPMGGPKSSCRATRGAMQAE